ncbi:MAG: aldehyde dehydrogenase [Deltaproteobacteria bacterium]|nr:aldehyde dehydrogenase [Deltaproteobacteria bacterium]
MASIPSTIDNFIDGTYVSPVSGRRMPDLDPATSQPLGELALSGPEDVDAAVSAAHAALNGPWGRTSVEERAAVLDAIADGIEARFDELILLESYDTGKPVWTSRNIDIARAVSNFRFYAGAVRHYSTDTHSMAGALNYTLRRRLGVVALITPWNLPLYLLTWKVAPALAMGNTVVCKPSEVTPLTAHALGRIAREAGLPDGVLNIVHGLGADVGAPLCAHPKVKAISFTGGTATGHKVAAAGAAGLKKVSLELGGKNPTMVFADCDLDRTVDGVLRASFANQGQVCLCGERLLVEDSIADAFVSRLSKQAAAMEIGDPRSPETRFGSQTSLAHRDKIESYVQLARDAGGRVVTGGERPSLGAPWDDGAFYAPTIIDGLPSDSRPALEEIFGPVVTVHRFSTDDEAVAMANEVEYGLSSSVWTSNLRRAHHVAAQIEAGTVWVNTWLKRDLRVPFGGMKASGVGREGGRYSLEFFSEPKNVCIDLT